MLDVAGVREAPWTSFDVYYATLIPPGCSNQEDSGQRTLRTEVPLCPSVGCGPLSNIPPGCSNQEDSGQRTLWAFLRTPLKHKG